MKKLIMLNGIKECGKSTAAKHLHSIYQMVDRQCKDRLHELTRELFAVPEKTYWDLYNSRDHKEVPSRHYMLERDAYNTLMRLLHGEDTDLITSAVRAPISPRNAMIYTSEILVKPSFGKDYFGRFRAESINEGEIALEDSAGFIEELYPAIEILGQENLLLIRIYGRGHNEGGDSRMYIPEGIIDNTIDIINDENMTLEAFLETVEGTVNEFLGYGYRNDLNANKLA